MASFLRGTARSAAMVTALVACLVTTAIGATDAQPAVSTVATAVAAPQTVIHGGAIPEGWTPRPIPQQTQGPDGKPITISIAPTYVFTYAIGPPTPVVARQPASTMVRRPQATPVARMPPPAMPASVPYGSNWVYQTQGVNPAPTSLVATSPPRPPVVAAWGGSALGGPPPPMTPPPPPVMAAAAQPPLGPAAVPPMQPIPQQYGGPLQPPPTQWTWAEPPAATAPAIAATTVALAPNQLPAAPPVAAAPATVPQAGPRTAAPRRWRVVGVYDGDTLTCLDDTNAKQKVRLAEIDAPERGQDFGTASREALADMVFGKTIDVVDQGQDRYGRWISRISVDGIDVNREMVAGGYAWHYAAYSSDPSLGQLQEQARSQRLGLWAQPNPIPPWEWRKNEKTAATADLPVSGSTRSITVEPSSPIRSVWFDVRGTVTPWLSPRRITVS